MTMVDTLPMDEALETEPKLGRSGLIGAAIGFLVSAIVIGTIGTLGGMQPGSAFGLGVFVGTWGGSGFGFMLGATVPFARYLDAQEESRHRG
jgi:hypothetical protein